MTVSKRTLGALGLDFLTLGSRLQKGELIPPDASAFKATLTSEIETFQAQAQRNGHSAEDIADARYALLAFLDEMILSSEWEGRIEWSQAPMLRERLAGERFYERLDAIRGRSKDVLGLYYDCLTLGYEGKFGVSQGRAELDQLIEQLKNELHQDDPLSKVPRQVPPGYLSPKAPFPWSLIGVLVVLLSALGWGLMRNSISTQLATVIDQINRVGGPE